MNIKYLLWAEGQSWPWNSDGVRSWALPCLQPGLLGHCRARIWHSAWSKLECFSKMKQLFSLTGALRAQSLAVSTFQNWQTEDREVEWLSLLPDPPHCRQQGCPGTWQYLFTLGGSASKTSWPVLAQVGPWSLSKTFSSVIKTCQDPSQNQWRE